MPATWTNKHNLPQNFVNAITRDDHVSLGEISVTQLIDSPQIRQLKKTMDYELDVMDMIQMMIGTGIHSRLEYGSIGNLQARKLIEAVGVLRELEEDKAADYLKKLINEKLPDSIDEDLIIEQTMTFEIEGWTLSGTADRFNISSGLLEDYKTSSASQLMYPEVKGQWTAQMNIYAVMLRSLGHEVNSARIVAILKDWSKMKIKTSKDYPKTPVVMQEIELIDNDRMIKYIAKRIKLHQRADAGEHIPCTDKERWAKPESFAVKLENGKKAIRLFETEKKAEDYIESNQHKHTGPLIIEHRRGESFRCANFCPVSEVCPQYAAEKEEALKDASKV